MDRRTGYKSSLVPLKRNKHVIGQFQISKVFASFSNNVSSILYYRSHQFAPTEDEKWYNYDCVNLC